MLRHLILFLNCLFSKRVQIKVICGIPQTITAQSKLQVYFLFCHDLSGDVVTPLELYNEPWNSMMHIGVFFCRKSQKLYNLDSIGTYNFLHAKQVATKVSTVVNFLGQKIKSPIDVLEKSPAVKFSRLRYLHSSIVNRCLFKIFLQRILLALQCQK